MRCSRWQVDISAYVDGSLEPEKRLAVVSHMEGCPDCTAFCLEQQRLARFLQSACPELDPPAVVWQRIQAKVGSRQPVRGRLDLWSFFDLLPFPKTAYAIAAIFLVLIVGLVSSVQYRSREESKRYLAELDAFTMETRGNPFLKDFGTENPFFGFAGIESDNPFNGLGSVRK